MVTVIGDPLGAFIPGIIFVVIGFLFLVKADLMLKFQIWTQKKIMDAKYIPGKETPVIVRAMGIVFLIIGIICLYIFFFANFS